MLVEDLWSSSDGNQLRCSHMKHQKRTSPALSIASLVVGIAAAVLCTHIYWPVTFAGGLVAVGLGIAALRTHAEKALLAKIGIALGAIIVLAIIVIVAIIVHNYSTMMSLLQ